MKRLRPIARAVAAFSLVGLAGSVLAQGPDSSGSGFFVNTAGWLVTNAHVVADCGRLEIPGYGNPRPLFIDDENDLAAVFVTGGPPVAPLNFRDGAPRLAEPVAAIGYPLSDVLSESVRVTTGTVSSLSGVGGDSRYLQLSAPIQPGNSGGPVVDAAGLVVGVASATLSQRAYDRAQNVNFAIKAELVVRFLSGNGISVSPRRADAVGGDLSLAAETGARATVPIRCYGARRPDPPVQPAARVPSAPGPAGMSVFRGTDFVGFDFDSVRNVDIGTCETLCSANGRCVAFTYNTRYAQCFLKDDAVLSIRNDDAIGGIRPFKLREVTQTGFRVFANADSIGGDYLRIRGSDFIPCFLECAGERRCAGFAYVRRTRDCWLKDRIGRLQRQDGVEFGMK